MYLEVLECPGPLRIHSISMCLTPYLFDQRSKFLAIECLPACKGSPVTRTSKSSIITSASIAKFDPVVIASRHQPIDHDSVGQLGRYCISFLRKRLVADYAAAVVEDAHP